MTQEFDKTWSEEWVDNHGTIGCMLIGMLFLSALCWAVGFSDKAQGFVFGATTMLAILYFIARSNPPKE